MPDVTTAIHPSSVDLIREGVTNRFTLRLDTSDPNRPLVILDLERVGTGFANLMRCHVTDSGQRVAADRPGCDPGLCIVDGDGKITEG